MPALSHLVGIVFWFAVLMLGVGLARRAALWRNGRATTVNWLGLFAIPKRYFVDLHHVVAREPFVANAHVAVAGGAVLALLIGAVAWYVTRNVVSPVSHAALVSEKLAAGQLQERMIVKGEDEVARLGASFNHMAASLQEQITQLATLSQMQQRFVSDVSHELRTPLTTVRMAAEVLYDAREDFDPINKRSAELLYNQVERFQSLLADLLEISRFDAGVATLDAEPGDIVQLVSHVMEGVAPVAAE